MAKKDHNFHVGLKAFLRKGDAFLALKDAYSDYWDIPGGRIEGKEIDQPVTECLRRELLEELGLNIRFEIDGVFDVTQFRIDSKNTLLPNRNLFLVFYSANFLGGEVVINEESLKFEWLTARSYRDYSFGNQQKAVDAYVANILTRTGS